MTITEAQDLYLRLIGVSGEWNAFNGPAIEAALRANTNAWRAVLLTREVYGSVKGTEAKLRDVVDLIVLRDLPKGLVNLSTMFLLAEPGHQDSLQKLAESWEADEVGWIDQAEAFSAMGDSASRNPEYASDPARVILRVWWD
jgi:hypothetical protein